MKEGYLRTLFHFFLKTMPLVAPDALIDTGKALKCKCKLLSNDFLKRDGSKMNEKNDYFKINYFLSKSLDEHMHLFKQIKKDKVLQSQCLEVANKLISVYRNKGKLLLCGNGGSADQAQHIAAELIGRFYLDRKALDAEAMSANSAALTALANDYRYEETFSRQIEAKGKAGDMLIAFTTSGQSKNIIEAVKMSHKREMTTVVLTGWKHLPHLLKYADNIISVPSKIIPRIQEAHIFIGHILCEYVERKLFTEK